MNGDAPYGQDTINGMPNRQRYLLPFKQCVLGLLSSPVSGNLQRQFQNTRMTHVAHLGGIFFFFVFECTHVSKLLLKYPTPFFCSGCGQSCGFNSIKQRGTFLFVF